jgi:RNA polymerase sigma-70 factor, ECF subfamily
MQLGFLFHQTPEESALVARAQEGDHQAFTQLVAPHLASIRRTAYSILRNREDAEDEVQNALSRAYQRLGQFQGDAKFSSWLTRVVVNQSLMRLRQLRRARLVYLSDCAEDNEGAVRELTARGASPEREMADAEVRALLAREMSRIPPLLREVLLLREVHELPMAMVAGRLGISLAAAKSRLLRARTELRERMRKQGGRMGISTLLA